MDIEDLRTLANSALCNRFDVCSECPLDGCSDCNGVAEEIAERLLRLLDSIPAGREEVSVDDLI